ncbi:LmeA family phospholipid-binding protein, partial [Pleurocapsales cyanobacterium LEGE 10410]|nr:LmeA family phospholipid-binding protein [Pleurocapsales cyanobacterium LEGE 10410]
MEILTIVLSGLLSLVSGGGKILDSIAQGQIGSQVISIEQQAVRVDNSPSYQVVQGELQKVRIANRGIRIKPGLRIAVLDLETDRVNLNLSKLDLDSIDELRESL